VEAVGIPLPPAADMEVLLRLEVVAMLVEVAAVVIAVAAVAMVVAAAGGKGSRLVLGVRAQKIYNRLNAGSPYERRSSETNFNCQWARSGGPPFFQTAAF